MAVILVTGAKGQLGSELHAESRKIFGHDFVFTDIETLDLTDGEETQEFFQKSKPDWVINCAAYNNVDKAESDYENALMVNGFAVKNIVSVIRDSPCRLIHISTDYVFNGKSAVPYRETDKPEPLSAYGKSKLEGEKYALVHPQSMVIRSSWLYSSYGHNFVKTILKLSAENNELRVVNDQTGSPTYAADLAHAILQIIMKVNNHQIAFNSGIFHYSNEGSCTWYEFACAIREEAGFSTPVVPVSSAEYHSAAVRPAWSVLNKSKISESYRIAIPHWRKSLSKCLNIITK
jgi:dTDP-4-dehydrorhamnose reductase